MAHVKATSELYKMAVQASEDSNEWFPNTAGNYFFTAACMSGEAGEVLNVLKKVVRGSMSLEAAMPLVRGEIADVFTYMLDLCGMLGIDLQEAYDVKREFNAVRFTAPDAPHRQSAG